MVTDFTFAGISALVLAIVGIAIMLLLHGRQTEQSDRLQSMISQQTELIKDTREVYAQTFVDYMQLVSIGYQNVIDRYESYTKIRSTDNDFLKSKDEKENNREYIKRQYDSLLITRQPKIEFMELVKTFGKNIAYRHW